MKQPPPRPLSAGQRAEFAQACRNVREGFGDVVNLVRIHNEWHDTGPASPLGTLNRLTAMLSVAAWESLIREIRVLTHPEADEQTRLRWRAKVYSRIEKDSKQKPIDALTVLQGAGAADVPDCWRVWVPTTGHGRTVRFKLRAQGLHGDAGRQLREQANWWIEVHNGVAHHNPGILEPEDDWKVTSLRRDREPGKAYWQPAQTINTTTARFCLALFLQLADQSIRAVARNAGFEHREELLLPPAWLQGHACDTPPAQDKPELRLGFGRSLVAPAGL